MIRMTCRVVPVIVVYGLLANLGWAGSSEEFFTSVPMHMHIWQVRPEVSRFEYHEPGLMKEEGTLYGIGGTYTYRPWADPNNLTSEGRYMLRLEGRFMSGEVDYDGALWNGAPYRMRGIDDKLLEFRVLGGRDFVDANNLATLYFGLGYRYLRDDSSEDPSGYLRESNYFYIPAGLQYTHNLSEEWALTPGVEFDFLFLGRQISHLGDGIHDIKNSQPFGYGLRGDLRLQKRFREFGLALNPFVTYWDVNKSDEVVRDGWAFFEPHNWSIEYGLRLIVAF